MGIKSNTFYVGQLNKNTGKVAKYFLSATTKVAINPVEALINNLK
jgi:hypothetical protein